MITTILTLALILCIVLLVIIYKGNKIESCFPWIWGNIGQPLFNYFCIFNDRKLIKVYLYTVSSICTINPLSKLILGTEIQKGDVIVKTILGVDSGVLDIWTFGVIVLLTITLCVYLYFTHRYDSKILHKPNKTIVVMYAANIAKDTPLLSYKMAIDALPKDYEPIEGCPIRIQVDNDSNNPDFWQKEADFLEKEFEKNIFPFMKMSKVNHVSLFAMASMPHLIKLGSLLNEKYSVEVYQKHRNPDNWNRLIEQTPDFIVKKPNNSSKRPVLVFSLSDKIRPRIEELYGDDASIWEVTTPNPNMDMMRTKEQQDNFRDLVRELLSEMSRMTKFETINVHMAMPIAASVELGRVWMPKPHKALAVYDYRGGKEKYTLTLKDK